MELRGMVALVTGASAGIGEEFSRQLHARGARVLLVARREDQLRRVSRDLPGSSVLVADLASSEGVRRVESLIEREGVDILVNNAGRGSFGRFEEISRDTEEELVRLNVLAPVRLAHAAIPSMRKRRTGVIVSVASIAGFQPLPYMSTYAATKAFDLFHGVALREELRGTGIRVITLCPGPTATEFGGVARVPGSLTGVARDSAESVVRNCLDTLDRDGALSIPGWRWKLVSLASRLTPYPLSTKLAARALRPALSSLGSSAHDS